MASTRSRLLFPFSALLTQTAPLRAFAAAEIGSANGGSGVFFLENKKTAGPCGR